ncbi:arginine--tRNA ligase [Helicobacter sp. 16-1353]|uniref:arginine--tRNA ligase n=1 Tax=Helicobacter sp. 16-1353 TaxID=2004996 RepID=UPI000DCB3C8C|nr:arginine--tRNA ligase [Helicobacter sp. 16-1353]RAX55240.1 arginine--tRNA ligase [Helicobacter sp. 16-1353]
MYKRIKNILDSTLGQNVILEIPKDSKMGHFATPIAFILAKQENKNPKEIAEEIKNKLQNIREFEIITTLNGFINLKLSDEFLSQVAEDSLKNQDNFAKDENQHQKILLEFVSANPTGPLHIGHARGAIFGDTLARIGKYLGYEIQKEYYINDSGSQIEMLGYSIFIAGQKILKDSGKQKEILDLPFIEGQEMKKVEVSYPKDYYKGEYIVDLANEAIEKFGSEIFSFKEFDKEFVYSNEKIIPKTIQKLSDFGVEKMLDLIKDNLKNANIVFDNFISEKSLMKDFVPVLTKLRENNAIYNDEKEHSKIWLKSTLKGDEKDRVIVRDSSCPTYLCGDIIYHNDKFMRGFDKYINIWGADHHGYIARIKASIDFLGYDSNKLEIILSQMVSLLKGGKPYKMSKRAGNFILMQDIIDEIGADALRFVFLSKKADTHLEFDIDVLKNEDSNNPIYYINYANARIHTILGKSTAKEMYDFSNLDSMWKDLLIYALLLPKILEGAFSERALQKLPEYLKNLASKLHFCYNSSKILNNPNEGSIISILKIVSLSITTGLSLMGITAKTKM